MKNDNYIHSKLYEYHDEILNLIIKGHSNGSIEKILLEKFDLDYIQSTNLISKVRICIKEQYKMKMEIATELIQMRLEDLYLNAGYDNRLKLDIIKYMAKIYGIENENTKYPRLEINEDLPYTTGFKIILEENKEENNDTDNLSINISSDNE